MSSWPDKSIYNGDPKSEHIWCKNSQLYSLTSVWVLHTPNGVPHVWLGCWTFPKDTIYPLYFNHLFEAPQDKKVSKQQYVIGL